MVAELIPGTYADVVTDDLVIRSRPGISADSEMYPDRLNAPTSVYLAEGPIRADGYDWFHIVGFDEAGTRPALMGWVAAAGKDGERWLAPIEHADVPWTSLPTDDAPTDIYLGSSAMGPDGQVYVFGDVSGGGSWAFDPATAGWRQLAPMPKPRREALVAAGADGLLYVVGGIAREDGDSATLQIYDPVANEWDTGPDAPATIFTSATALPAVGGRVRIAQGRSLYSYQPSTRTWRTEAAPAFVSDASVGADGTLYFLLPDATSVVPYDPAKGRAGDRLDVPGITRFDAAITAASDGSLLVIGGAASPLGATCSGFRDSAGWTPLVQAVDLATGRWTTLAPLPEPLAAVRAFETATGVLVMGFRASEAEDYVPSVGEPVAYHMDIAPNPTTPDLASTDQETSHTGCGP